MRFSETEHGGLLAMWQSPPKCFVCLTFDVDFEFAWSKDVQMFESTLQGKALMALGLRRILGTSLVTESQGEYGRRVGLGRVLEMLDRYDLKATFFVPGVHAENYPAIIEDLHSRGHELAHHGYNHESPLHFDGKEDKERAQLEKGIEALQRITGQRPKGYRAPALDLTEQTLHLLSEQEFLYDSSLMADEKPYRIEVAGADSRLLELPVDWVLDDWPHFAFWKPPIYMCGMSTPSQVLEIWLREFEGYYANGGCFTLTMHPSIIGRSHRIQIVEELIKEIRLRADVRFARCIDVVEHINDA